ncbi:MAG: universal stress protein [Solirubrobacterales bacterium]|nr:universal stress protein [Solirubrobacterales bacterium]
MTIVVGFAPDEHGKDALSLAAMLARSSGRSLVVVSVVRRPWPIPLSGPESDEEEAYARKRYDRARSILPDGITVEFIVQRSRSIPGALLEAAGERQADLLVLGSSSDGVFGHIALGSVSNHVLHSSEVAVAVAPRGFRYAREARLRRISLAFGSSGRASLLETAAGRAAEFGVPLRLVSFMSRSRPDYTMTLGVEGDTAMLEAWAAEMGLALNRAVEEVRAMPGAPVVETPEIGHGGSWDEALEDIDWMVDEILVLGSSGLGPAARVFLGSRANKILRHSPVAAIVLPRALAEKPSRESS